MSQQNSSFLPGTQFQFAWDSTSMGLLKECPRKYYYSIIEGWTSRLDNVHLVFGIAYHGALECYDHARAKGHDHAQAVIFATRYALTTTWDQQRKRPWTSDDANKNRFTLVRTVVWYLATFEHDSISTVILANGKPAVELSFRFQTTFISPSGQPYVLCGHLDRLGKLDGVNYIVDRKTTKWTIGDDFFLKYSPDNQMSTYSFAGKVVYHSQVRGVIIDAAQVAVGWSRFERGFANRTDGQLEEWYEGIGQYIKLAEVYASTNTWPMNDKACGMYGGCPFRKVCGQDPAVRVGWLKANFVKRVWDPLLVRGDV